MAENKNIVKVYTTSSGAELSISAPSTKEVIQATNNRAQYFAEQALKYRDEARQYRDSAKYYAEANADVTFEYINNVKSALEDKIKEDLVPYAKKEELPTLVSELENDSNYVNNVELSAAIDEVRLPSQEGCVGKFLMSDGETAKWAAINSFNIFDTKLSDHLLEGEESLGWALQGSFVSKAIYPDFYNKCLEQKETATATETTLGGSAITLYNNSNGHKFYDIADKAVVDNFYSAMGVAWFYGVDTENERIFLPRNKYLTSYIADGAKTVSVVGNGMAIGLEAAGSYYGLCSADTHILAGRTGAYGIQSGDTTYTGNWNPSGHTFGLTDDPTKSGITGSVNLENSSNEQYVYICVGNTTVNETLVDVGQLSSDLQYKADRTELEIFKKAYITETYVNGTSWYRIYSDGWCEQGGIVKASSNGAVSITFVKPYINSDYNIDCGTYYGTSASSTANSIQNQEAWNVTISGFSTYGLSAYPKYWKTSGYIV